MADTSAGAVKKLAQILEDGGTIFAQAEAASKLRALLTERDQALARERALLDSNQEARDFLKERDTLRRERDEARNALKVYACAKNWTNGCEWDGLHAPRIVALEALKSFPAPRVSVQEAAKVLADWIDSNMLDANQLIDAFGSVAISMDTPARHWLSQVIRALVQREQVDG